MAKQIVSDIHRGIETSVSDKVDMTKGILRSKVISAAVTSGDAVVTRAVNDAALFMGMGLASVMNVLNPQRIILGGGLVEAVDHYLKAASVEARYRALRIASKKVEIVKAELVDYAGVVGAALLVKDSHSRVGVVGNG